ncbi:MAG: hypothetical protein ACE3L7_33645 [Candidatus Pristimantibacillus sp.]|uniref:hypothetical protein n=1 Tax=Paenibacillus sp. LS1 TaxID=2992120 RepID=UPI0022319E69|nr:hypothetical protein [Paenibacillus sp. LS1]MCW3793958.1 hypothetical protein [Paenibacillus sp. LS1]
MTSNDNKFVKAFEEAEEVGNGVYAVPPQNNVEKQELDRLMQEYLITKRNIKPAKKG